MDPVFWALIALFVVSDLFVAYFVVRAARRRRVERTQAETSDDMARRIGLE